MSDWQPINIAPMGGSTIDLWCVNDRVPHGLRLPDCEWDSRDGRWIDQDCEPIEPRLVPTHWMFCPRGPSDRAVPQSPIERFEQGTKE